MQRGSGSFWLRFCAASEVGSEPKRDIPRSLCYETSEAFIQVKPTNRGHSMIMRIFQVLVREGKEKEFGEFFHNTAIPLMKGTDGIVQVLPGEPRKDSPREFSFVMVWRDLASLKAFVGEDYQSPHIDPAEAELVEDRTIKHYNLVE